MQERRHKLTRKRLSCLEPSHASAKFNAKFAALRSFKTGEVKLSDEMLLLYLFNEYDYFLILSPKSQRQ